MAWKSGLKMPLLPLGTSCPLQTILLSYIVWYNSPMQIKMAVWRIFFLNLKRVKQLLLSKKVCHYYLQKAVTPDWMGSIAPLRTYHGIFIEA